MADSDTTNRLQRECHFSATGWAWQDAVGRCTCAPAPPPVRDPMYCCDTCGRGLFKGDLAFVYEDGPAFCEEHAPTWSDLKREQDELIAAGTFDDLFDEGKEEAEGARASVLKRIEAGEGDVRVSSPLP